jgi:signal transduction histidine kinase
VSLAVSVGGWVTAALLTATVLILRSTLHRRTESVTRACHELRGPITAARLGLSLGSRFGELSPARLRAIDTELSRAALALQDLGDLSRGGPRLRELELVDLQALLDDSVEAWQGGARAAGVTLRINWSGSPTTVRGDRLRLAQATGNLIANAIEHGGSDVEVRGCARAYGTRIEVIDDGPGLPAPVAQLARRARRGLGARGRGLAIASAIADAHGGRLAAAPAQLGARVVLEFPACANRRATPAGGRRDDAG